MKPRIVLVDDEQSVLDSLQRNLRAYRSTWDMLTFTCPDQAWEYIKTNGADTVVSDLRMPHIDGLQFLAKMQQAEQTKDIPFIILTGQGDRELRRKALESGATDLLTKPADPDDLLARIRSALRLKSHQDELKLNNAQLEQKVIERTRELNHSRLEVIWRLAKAAEFRDEDTGNHVIRVASYSREIAKTLGLDRDFITKLFLTAPLHDIGKIGIPDAILLKPGKLTDAEWQVMKTHCAIGARILRDDCKAPIAAECRQDDALAGAYSTTQASCENTLQSQGYDDPMLEMASRIAMTHHEKWDGSGYPQGLRGEAIPLEARIVALADVYDALTSGRPYKQPFSAEKALEIIREGIGKHFDPQIHEAFSASVDEIQAIQSSLTDHAEAPAHEETRHETCAVCG